MGSRQLSRTVYNTPPSFGSMTPGREDGGIEIRNQLRKKVNTQ